MTALRALGVYVLMLVVIRVLGKRTVGNFAAFDLLVALMLGEVVDEIIYGDVSIAQGLVAVGVVSAAQYGNAWLSYWDHGFDRVLEGTPTPIVRNGEMVVKGMRQERMNAKAVMHEPRIGRIEDVKGDVASRNGDDAEASVLVRTDRSSDVRITHGAPAPGERGVAADGTGGPGPVRDASRDQARVTTANG